MFNLKKFNGTFKGTIGECMFKLTKPYVVLTRLYNKNKYLRTFGSKLTMSQKEFLMRYWYSFDGVEFVMLSGEKRIVLYEIKTRNGYRKYLRFLPKVTRSSHEIYQRSKQLGFIPKLVTVWLEDNWNFEIESKDFCEKYYCIDKPKKYDKR